MSRHIIMEWIPAAKELPTHNMPVLVCRKNKLNEVFACDFDDGLFRYIIGRDPIENIEWWCSFPKAPWYNFEGGWGQLNQGLRDGSINIMSLDKEQYCASIAAAISESRKKMEYKRKT